MSDYIQIFNAVILTVANTAEDVVKSFLIAGLDESSPLYAKLIKKNSTLMKIYEVVSDYKAVDIFRHTIKKNNKERDMWIVESIVKCKKHEYYPRSLKKVMMEPLRNIGDTNLRLIYDQAHIYSITRDTINYGRPPCSCGNPANCVKKNIVSILTTKGITQ